LDGQSKKFGGIVFESRHLEDQEGDIRGNRFGRQSDLNDSVLWKMVGLGMCSV
jgi:hypothetical protein